MRRAEPIIDEIRGLIRRGDLAVGDRLPAEDALRARFGVSRVVVREAVRVLEAGGLVEVKPGARGGVFVTVPTSRLVGTGIADLVTMAGLSASEVTETRMVVELGIVPLVCERATEDDIAALDDICDRSVAALGRDEFVPALSVEFHTRCAQAAHNDAVLALVTSLRDPLVMSLERARHRAPLHGLRGVLEHRELVGAIAARDVRTATEIMRMHLERTMLAIADVPEQVAVLGNAGH